MVGDGEVGRGEAEDVEGGGTARASAVEAVADVAAGLGEEVALGDGERDVAAEAGAMHAFLEGGEVLAGGFAGEWCHSPLFFQALSV